MKFHRREFLNKKEGIAAIEAVLVVFERGFADGRLSVSDCSRQVTLEFGYSNKKHYTRQLDKINTLLETVHALQTAMINNPPKEEEEGDDD